jgi:hypothetical protein
MAMIGIVTMQLFTDRELMAYAQRQAIDQFLEIPKSDCNSNRNEILTKKPLSWWESGFYRED